MHALTSNLTKFTSISARRVNVVPKPIAPIRISSSNVATAKKFEQLPTKSAMIKPAPFGQQSWRNQHLTGAFANYKSEYDFHSRSQTTEVNESSILDVFLMSTPIILIFQYLITEDKVDQKAKWLQGLGSALSALNEITDEQQIEGVRGILQKTQSEIDRIKDKEEKKIALMALHSVYYHFYQITASTDQELNMAAHHLQKCLDHFLEYSKNFPNAASKEEFEEIKATIEVHLGRLFYAIPVEKALEYAKEAESIISRQFGSKSGHASSATLVLADIYHYKEDFTRALSLYQEVLANRDTLIPLDASKPEFMEYLRPLISLACCNVSLNNSKDAANLLQSKFKAFKNTDTEIYLYNLFNLRELLVNSKNFEVLKFVDDNIETVLQKNKRKFGEEPFIAFYSHRGAAAAENKQWSESLQYFEKAIYMLQPLIKSNPNYVPQLAELKASAAKIYETRNSKGDVNAADKLYVEAINMLSQVDDARTELIAVSYILFLQKNGKNEKANELVDNLSPEFKKMYEALAREQRLLKI